jgi:hypothetical protein
MRANARDRIFGGGGRVETPADVFAERNWPELRAAYLEPPLAAVVGARLGLDSTPTTSALVAAVAAMARTIRG